MILIPLITIYIPNILAKVVKEPQATYAILHENGDEFLITDELPDQDKIVAGAHFTNAINQTGYEQKLMVLLNFSKQEFFFLFSWANFEVWTNGEFPDTIQVKAAGFLEGYLTHELIYMSFLNTLQDYCKGRDEYCEKLRSHLAANSKWISKMCSKLRKTSPFWHQVFKKQLKN